MAGAGCGAAGVLATTAAARFEVFCSSVVAMLSSAAMAAGSVVADLASWIACVSVVISCVAAAMADVSLLKSSVSWVILSCKLAMRLPSFVTVCATAATCFSICWTSALVATGGLGGKNGNASFGSGGGSPSSDPLS